MHNRIRLLRETKKLSRAAFGEKIGVSGDVINNLERGRVEIKEHIIKLICTQFSVNENWLRNGNEPMFLKTSDSIMEQLREEFHLDDFSFSLVYEYLKLDEDKRHIVQEYVYNVMKVPQPTSQTPLEEMSLEELAVEREKAEAEYIKSISNSVKKTTSAVLNTTVDTQSLKNKDTNNKVSNQ